MENFTVTQTEIVQKFLSLLTGLTRECGVEIVDSGGFLFRMHDGKPYLTVSRDFLGHLGNHAINLSLDSPATTDVVAKLEVEKSIVNITNNGGIYSASCTTELSNRQPLYIRQLLNRKTLSGDEYNVLVEYLRSHNIETVEVKPVVEVKTESKDVKSVPSIQNSDSDAEDSEIESQPRVNIPSEDSEASAHKSPVKPVKSPVKSVKSPVKQVKSPVKSQKLNVVFFKKNADGSKDKTVCRSGKYVYKLVAENGKTQLVGIGVYDARTNNYTPLGKSDKAEIIKLGFTV